MKLGTIGSGKIVQEMLRAIEPIEEVTCVAAYSRKQETADALAGDFQIPKTYTSLEAFFSDEELDTVYIASPNKLHMKQALQALENKKHVICEKPFTPTAKEAKELKKAAKENNVFVFEAIPTLFLPNFIELSNHIERLGPIRLIQCNYSQYSSRYDQLKAGEVTNIFDPAFAGGALADINVYNLHFVLRLFGKPSEVVYKANLFENGVDTSGIALLSYPGFQASCVGSKDTAGENFVSIQGEDGYMYIKPGANGARSVKITIDGKTKDISVKQDRARLTYEFIHFNRIIQNNNREVFEELIDHTIAVAEVLEDARGQAGLS
ncbi:Gfo/Idh/MocA family protein [Oceanobacillus jeddahense]|uniref:Gfo/Idh/MocA family oxidoreductase n=1 Tax=Oceanobacillus jeddahense TaxID=1462527 RepID=A0ABY5JR47_9BACI|nr:Gfo/Idh/MocA family oxidoreductase [Oceanobacillus jeddahense]UUI02275.1 Gfo/Idh/MocA family oxidoreductase [Oceanobacillus jeddahense]